MKPNESQLLGIGQDSARNNVWKIYRTSAFMYAEGCCFVSASIYLVWGNPDPVSETNIIIAFNFTNVSTDSEIYKLSMAMPTDKMRKVLKSNYTPLAHAPIGSPIHKKCIDFLADGFDWWDACYCLINPAQDRDTIKRNGSWITVKEIE